MNNYADAAQCAKSYNPSTLAAASPPIQRELLSTQQALSNLESFAFTLIERLSPVSDLRPSPECGDKGEITKGPSSDVGAQIANLGYRIRDLTDKLQRAAGTLEI